MWWLLLWACTDVPEPTAPQAESVVQSHASSPSVRVSEARSLQSPLNSTPSLEQAEKSLSAIVKAHTRDPANPWAIGHGLVAEGQNMTLSNGQLAVEWLFSTYAERFQLGAEWLLRFPEARDKTRIEPHPDLLLKAIADAGISPAHPVTVKGHPHTVQDLYRGVLSETFFDAETGKSSFSTPNDLPWSLFGIASWAPPNLAWTDAAGHSTALNDLTDHAAQSLDTATEFIAQAANKGTSFQKKRQGIFSFTCGGAHMIQGVIHARLLGFGQPPPDGPFQDQLRLLVYRFPIELQQIDTGLASHPEYRVQLLVQRLKLTGHTLETVARIAASGEAGAPTSEQIAAYAEHLAASVALLRDAGVFKNLSDIRETSEQLYLDVVGDSAHALRGLRIATGQASVSY